mmetsp:Transcript_130743/g.297770  ORF Transcript_130743/g.297770 Transcript_130743/m.297770 type:complete len:361 (-) Transcript_130743:88-1170(-)
MAEQPVFLEEVPDGAAEGQPYNSDSAPADAAPAREFRDRPLIVQLDEGSVPGRGGACLACVAGVQYLFGGESRESKTCFPGLFWRTDGKWQEATVTGDPLRPLSGATMVEVRGALYIFGGQDPEGQSGATYRLELQAQGEVVSTKWEHSSTPPARNSHAAVALRKHPHVMLIWGGAGPEPRGDAHVLDTRTGEWKEVALEAGDDGEPPALQMHSLLPGFLGDSERVMLIGGQHEGGINDSLWELEIDEAGGHWIAKWLRKDPLPFARASCGVAVQGRTVLVCGGVEQRGGDMGLAPTIWGLDIDCTEAGPKVTFAEFDDSEGPWPLPRFGLSACSDGTDFLVFGGSAPEAEKSDLCRIVI